MSAQIDQFANQSQKTTHIVESFWSICQVQATTPAS